MGRTLTACLYFFAMTFENLEKFLYSHSNNKIIPGLKRIQKLLVRLGNPQDSFKSVHIVGTNGKGSTGAFISSIMSSSGYKTAFYSSPHLESPGERLLIDGEPLSPDEWFSSAEEAVKFIRPDEDLPSYFELLTACAFLLMREHRIDVGVIEAGLGGKLDATNTMSNTVCSVIASISIDHTEYLGSSLEDIAGEKFAVVRRNVPACFSGVDASLVPMFRRVCAERGAVPFVVSEEAREENVRVSPEGNVFGFSCPGLELKEVRTGLIGRYQVSNAMLALSAVSRVCGEFVGITEASILEGMSRAKWPGRLEVVSREPLIVLDGGHNYDGVRNLCASVRELWPDKRIGVVYAAMRDKDYAGCLRLLSERLEPKLYVTTVPGMARALSAGEMLRTAQKFSWSNEPEEFELPDEAVKRAGNDFNDVILVCGSLYLIGWVRAKICNLAEESNDTSQ